MAPKASRSKGKGAAADKDAAPPALQKGSWEGSWVKEKQIELLRRGRVLPPADLAGCRPAGSERVPAPEPGEAVVFYDHFPRGFALPASSFMRRFLDHFRLQPHHIGANAMMILSAFATLCKAYLGIRPNVELFRRLIYFKTQMAETVPVICGTASFYARKTADFAGIKGKESCNKWQRSFFYAKNLKEGEDHINLPPFEAGGPERDNWSAALPRPSPDMEEILLRVTTLQTEGGLESTDLLLAFLVARVSPLQRRSHKMCFLGSARDPTRHSSKVLSALEVARKANCIANVKLQASWTWGLEPHDRDNPIAEVSSSVLAPALLLLRDSDLLSSVYLVWAELVCSAGGGEFDSASSWLCR
jgi:hypothetical protein